MRAKTLSPNQQLIKTETTYPRYSVPPAEQSTTRHAYLIDFIGEK